MFKKTPPSSVDVLKFSKGCLRWMCLEKTPKPAFSWWFQPIWKIIWIISPGRDENKKYLSCHHPAIHWCLCTQKKTHHLKPVTSVGHFFNPPSRVFTKNHSKSPGDSWCWPLLPIAPRCLKHGGTLRRNDENCSDWPWREVAMMTMNDDDGGGDDEYDVW